MARVVWPDEVTERLDEIARYISRDNPVAADRIASRLIALGESLREFPNRGRPARDGAREMTGVPPYILRYRVIGDVVVIVGIQHGRQRPI